jgi:nitroimidazol reductase NimA-like FMN-containing flavoprotein (pyridoxamine 5'-phosphate oxidase superfamily)
MKEIPAKIKMLLAEGRFTYFCTTDAAFRPHVTPMFFVYEVKSNKIFLMSTRYSKKVRNLKSNNSVSLTMDVRDPINPFLNYGVMIQGVANVLDLKKHMGVLETFTRKYPRFVRKEKPRGKLLHAYPDVLIQVTPKVMIYWRGAHFTRWEAT